MNDAGKPKPASLPSDHDPVDVAAPDDPAPAPAGDVKSRNKDELWVTGVWLQQAMQFWASTEDGTFVIGEQGDSGHDKCPVTGHLSVVSSGESGPSVVVDSVSPDSPAAREIIREGVREATGWETSFMLSKAI
jgi:hypothetical protein